MPCERAPYPLGQLRVVGDDHPALADREVLVGEEAEATCAAERSAGAAPMCRSGRMRRVLERRRGGVGARFLRVPPCRRRTRRSGARATTFVLAVTAASTSAGSRLRSSGPRMSQKTGVAPVCPITFAAATKLSEGTITSSPGPHPQASSARWRAAVPLETARACRVPQKAAKACSNSCTCGPMLHQPDAMVLRAASTISESTTRSESGIDHVASVLELTDKV